MGREHNDVMAICEASGDDKKDNGQPQDENKSNVKSNLTVTVAYDGKMTAATTSPPEMKPQTMKMMISMASMTRLQQLMTILLSVLIWTYRYGWVLTRTKSILWGFCNF